MTPCAKRCSDRRIGSRSHRQGGERGARERSPVCGQTADEIRQKGKLLMEKVRKTSSRDYRHGRRRAPL
jgi:hypothetical protein